MDVNWKYNIYEICTVENTQKQSKVSEPDICKNSQAKLTRFSQVGEIFTGLVDHFPSQEWDQSQTKQSTTVHNDCPKMGLEKYD